MTCTSETGAHCWHEADGALFQRHAGRPRALVPLVCCWCAFTAQMQGHAPHVAAKTFTDTHEHGAHDPRKAEEAA